MRFEKSQTRKEIDRLEVQLTPENKEYLGKLNGYMMLSSLFHHAEDQMEALLLPIYQDVLQAQQDGMSAEDYLGKDTKAMADELLADLPPMKWHYGLRVSGAIALSYMAWGYLMDFALEGRVKLEPIGVVCDVLIALILPAVAFYLLKGLIYTTSKVRALVTYIGFGGLFAGLLFFRWWLARYVEMTVYPLSTVPSLLVVAGFGLALFYYRKEKLFHYTFVLPYLVLVVSGFGRMGLDAAQIPVTHWLDWLHAGFVFLAPVLGMLGSIFYILWKDKEK